jgi:pyruvate ferredoxin oxidoreductase gamma subunit
VIRIRFHGRGGHGVKTASRIVGTAAFLAGYECQDSPIYGAERRGAAVAAFTRISREPILERGMIADPNLIVLADETLLRDRGRGPVGAGLRGGDAEQRAPLANVKVRHSSAVVCTRYHGPHTHAGRRRPRAGLRAARLIGIVTSST